GRPTSTHPACHGSMQCTVVSSVLTYPRTAGVPRTPSSSHIWTRRTTLTHEFRGQDLNLRPPGYEPGELPLLHPGINPYLDAALPFPPLWPRNVRVGENSPSLCPTMSSVTKHL